MSYIDQRKLDDQRQLDTINVQIDKLQDEIDEIGNDPKQQARKVELARQRQSLLNRRTAMIKQ